MSVHAGTAGFPPDAFPEELVVTAVDGRTQLWVHFVDGLVYPWCETFDEAMAANPEAEMDCTLAP